jgi:hypothetical protein
MPVSIAYFDAGGSAADPKSRVLSVAGYIATQERWDRLERDWIAVLEREQISIFHMKDVAHWRGEFRSWKDDEPRRQRFLNDLAAIIRRHTRREFSVSIFLDGYRAVDAAYRLHEEVGHPYMACAWLCISDVLAWAKEQRPLHEILFVFEKGDAHQAELTRLLRQSHVKLGEDPIFLDKNAAGDGHGCVPLQCADFLAYEHAKNLTDIYLKGRTKARGSLFVLTKAPKDPERLERLARRWRVLPSTFWEELRKARNVSARSGVSGSVAVSSEFDSFRKTLGDKVHMLRSQSKK